MAQQLGADPCTVTNWELNRTTPALRFLPGIIDLIGYLPRAGGASIGERLLAYRRERGLSQAALARLLGIDPRTLSRWERNVRIPRGRCRRPVEAFLERFIGQHSIPTGITGQLSTPS